MHSSNSNIRIVMNEAVRGLGPGMLYCIGGISEGDST